jgi:hypothetical protein
MALNKDTTSDLTFPSPQGRPESEQFKGLTKQFGTRLRNLPAPGSLLG